MKEEAPTEAASFVSTSIDFPRAHPGTTARTSARYGRSLIPNLEFHLHSRSRFACFFFP